MNVLNQDPVLRRRYKRIVPDDNISSNVSEEVERAISIINKGDESDLVVQLSKLYAMDFASCEQECINSFMSTLPPMLSGWSPDVLHQVAKLLLMLQEHRHFSEMHAKALLVQLFTIVLEIPMGQSENAATTVTALGDLIRSLISKCLFDETEYLDIEIYSRQVLEYEIHEKRRIFSMLYLGLLDSRTDPILLERHAIPILKSMLGVDNEKIIRGDVVYILLKVMRDYPMRTRMREIWPEIPYLWYYRTPLGESIMNSTLATFLELFRNDDELRSVSESMHDTICELQIDTVQFVRKKCSTMAATMSAHDARFLKFFTSSIGRLFRIVAQVGNCELRAEIFGLVHDLSGCYLHDVRLEISKALPSISRMVFELKHIECPNVGTAVSAGCFGRLLNFLPTVPITCSTIKSPLAKEIVHADRFYGTLAKLMGDKQKSVRGEMLKGLGPVMNSLSDYPRLCAVNGRLCQEVTHIVQCDGYEARLCVKNQLDVISRIYSGHGTR